VLEAAERLGLESATSITAETTAPKPTVEHLTEPPVSARVPQVTSTEAASTSSGPLAVGVTSVIARPALKPEVALPIRHPKVGAGDHAPQPSAAPREQPFAPEDDE
jgi:hypothetical protein